MNPVAIHRRHMTRSPFSRWLRDVASDPVVVDRDDIGAEGLGNEWIFTLTPEEAAIVTIADVEAFAAAVVEVRRAWLLALGASSMVMYWWHEAPAGALCFSLVSAGHGFLPFRRSVIPAASLRAVAVAWLGSPYLKGTPSEEFVAVDPSLDDEISEMPLPDLPVWSMRLP
jgi:hypothetical protein